MAAPVSWLAIKPGWKVYASDGSRVGEVDEVAGDERRDIFDGISIATSALGRPIYAEGEQVARIEQDAVHLKISGEQARGLAEYLEPASSEQIEPDDHRGAGESIAAGLREMEGRIAAPTQRHEHEANLLTRIALFFRRMRGK